MRFWFVNGHSQRHKPERDEAAGLLALSPDCPEPSTLAGVGFPSNRFSVTENPKENKMSNASVALQPETRTEDLDTGLADDYRAEIADDLSVILAATYRLTIKSHLYHWNVVGPLFRSLHKITEDHYEALFAATDIIAERIRALGHTAPFDLNETLNFAPASTDIAEPTAEDMLNDLIVDHSAAVRSIRQAALAADEAGDIVTADMLTDRSAFHEKALWMLKAIVSK